MKLLDRYLLKSFFSPLGVCIAIFCILVVMGRFFDKMQIFTNYHAHVKDIVLYLILSLPFWLNLVLPVATMLAVLFSLGSFNQRGEMTACRSAGIGTFRLLTPYLAVGFLLSIFCLVGSLTFLPKCNLAARAVYRLKIKQEPIVNYISDHIVSAGLNNRRFTIDSLDIAKGEMKNVIVDRFNDQSEWVESITGREAHYIGGHWIFMNGVLRRADPAHHGPILEQDFTEMPVDIREKPEDFATEDKNPEDMTGRELLDRIKKLSQKGVGVNKERVAFHMKIALPFANMVVIALAIPFALKGTRQSQGRAQTFSYALALAFLYWGVTSVCQSFGEQGRIPAWLSAWITNVVFSIFAVWRLVRAT